MVSARCSWHAISVDRVADLSQLAPGRGLCVVAHGCRIALIRSGDQVFAVDDACPHRGGPLSEGDVEDGAIACPIHGWAFDLSTGQMRGTSGVRVGTYPTELRGTEIWVGPRR